MDAMLAFEMLKNKKGLAFDVERCKILDEYLSGLSPQERVKASEIQAKLNGHQLSNPDEHLLFLMSELGEALENMSDQFNAIKNSL